MTEALDLQAEPFSAHGNIGGRGVAKILGTPKHDRLQVLIRETVQNSWDAALDDIQVNYHFGLRTLNDDELRFLAEKVFERRSYEAAENTLDTSLSKDSIRVIEIADYGTSGLGGPTVANDLNDTGEPTDFVDFVRNIGAPRDKEHGGGTYGYGKTSLYAASKCSTIVVYSCCSHNDERQHRLIACRLGDPFTIRDGQARGKYTGRFWWGEIRDDVIEPVIGDRAKEMAAGLGIPVRADDDTGTTVLIIDPLRDKRSPEQMIGATHETLLWTYWPKMVEDEANPNRMHFKVSLEGEDRPLPKPEDFPPLNVFVDAMRKLKAGKAVEDIGCLRPRTHLGKLVMSKYPVEDRAYLDTGARNAVDMDRSHHVALMRPAELVVDYLAGPELRSDNVEYAGVFICDHDVEHAFAAAEPPAHDEWNHQYLERPEKTFVRQAIKRIKDHMTEYSGARATAGPGGSSDTPLGLASDTLGNLLLGHSGPGLGGQPPGGNTPPGRGTAGRGRQHRVSTPEFIGFTGTEDHVTPAAMFRMTIDGVGQFSGVLSVIPSVQLDGGSSTADPSGVDAPELTYWTDDQGNRIGSDNPLRLDSDSPRTLIACVSVPDNCALKVRARLEQNE